MQLPRINKLTTPVLATAVAVLMSNSYSAPLSSQFEGLNDVSELVSFKVKFSADIAWDYSDFTQAQLDNMAQFGLADATDTWVYEGDMTGVWYYDASCQGVYCPRVFQATSVTGSVSSIASSSAVPVNEGFAEFSQYPNTREIADVFTAYDNNDDSISNSTSYARDGILFVEHTLNGDCPEELTYYDCFSRPRVREYRTLEFLGDPDFSTFNNLTEALELLVDRASEFVAKESIESADESGELYDVTREGTAVIRDVQILSYPNEEVESEKPASCRFVLAAEWDTGFTGFVHMKNETSETLDGWNLNVDFPVDVIINSSWSANFTGTSPNYTASHLSWNKLIYPGQEINFGFVGTKASGESVAQTDISGDICR